VNVDDFDYELPQERIAQTPAEPRDSARLFVHAWPQDVSAHAHVRDLPDYLRAGDLLVFNDTRVLPARVFGKRATGGRVEFLFVEPDEAAWRAMVQPAKKLRPDELIELADGTQLRMLERVHAAGKATPLWRVAAAGAEPLPAILERLGRMPLPPYIERSDDESQRIDPERYQTIYAREPGAVAAPTAGLHFTDELLARLRAAGIDLAWVTLHVGLGTFLPVQVERVEEHTMHAERYELSVETAQAIEACRARGGRVIAVGTTCVRVLESCARTDGVPQPSAGSTSIFITPGHRWNVVDGLLTNFHLPRSTLLMLVSALVGRERCLALYRTAVERGYRFYSYGDAQLLLPGAEWTA